MHITRLRLAGFKSFVEPTDLLIEPGLSGVVGPNGCGKSNLLEALRWAMGEASHKSMRAAAMDDVIFSGTVTRPARNHASVTLFIDNSARRAPAEFNDSDTLEIMRHIEREAGSAYRINGREARARDVKILFEDAATGARSPALVRQGQVAELVNAKPEQRRRILEDAAGTAGLSSRRHDAELRLRAAEGNLDKAADVLGGFLAQINGLKRQARAAARYREITAELKALEAIALVLAWRAAQGDVAAEEALLGEALSVLALAVAGEGRALQAEIAAAGELPGLREAEVTAAAVVQRLRLEADGLAREEARAKERQTELFSREQQLMADMEREAGFAREADAAGAQLAEEKARLAAEAGTDEGSIAAATEELARARGAETVAQDELSSLTNSLADARANRQRLESQLAEETRRFGKVDGLLADIGRQMAVVEGAVETGSSVPPTRRSAPTSPQGGGGDLRLGAKQVDLDDLKERRDALDEAIFTAESRIESAEAAIIAARRAEEAARATATERRLAAEKIATEHATLSRLFAPPKDDSAPPVLDGLKVARGYEIALGAALGDDLDASADSKAAVHWAETRGDTDDQPLPEGAEPLLAKVKNAGPLTRRLRQIGVVAKADGLRLRALLQPGQRLVTKSGDLWRWDGFSAAANAPSAGARRLEQRVRLEELSLMLDEAEDRAHEAVEALSNAALAHERAAAVERSARDDLSRLRREHTELSADLARLEQAAREREVRLSRLTEDRARIEEAIAEHRSRIGVLTAELATLPDLHRIAAARDGRALKAQSSRAETGKAELALNALAAARQQRCQRSAAIVADVKRWAERAATAASQIAALEDRKRETAALLAELADSPDRIVETRERLLDQISTAEAGRRAAADTLTAAEAGMRDAHKTLRDLQAELSSARERKARLESRLEAARDRRSAAARTIADTFDCTPEQCLARADHAPDAPVPSAEDTTKRLAHLRADRERLGGVNLAAEEELTVLETQYKNLEAEKADLEAAIAQLRQGIAKLTREGRKRLNEAFEQVNTHFQRLFTTLFNGGEARLEMIEDPDDPLAGGLEIIAKPPGKKPATLSLLSGGEQTLTALSLIFAVFLTNPSPVCVLDEVDAPLDDSNVDRFCNLMEEMGRATETRFLVITHHPMTMSRMDRLFGVTMAEKGVSQLVSVDLATAEQFREAG